jgi:hypothetical protein
MHELVSKLPLPWYFFSRNNLKKLSPDFVRRQDG